MLPKPEGSNALAIKILRDYVAHLDHFLCIDEDEVDEVVRIIEQMDSIDASIRKLEVVSE